MLGLGLAAACGPSGEEDGTPADPAGLCEDPPVITYANFGQGFMIETCQSCHASTSQARNGAPESVTFDSHEEVLAWRDRIYERTLGEEAGMPPAGGVSEDDLQRLEIWLVCWDGQ